MSNSTDFAIKMMQEIGLELGPNNYVVDQDTGDMLSFKGKKARFTPEDQTPIIHRDDIPFDPLNNPNMMSQLFNYYTNKLEEQDGRYIVVAYPSSQERTEKGTVSCKEGNTTVQSDEYYKDSLKYGSLICKLNGGDEKFNEYDQAPLIKRRKRK